MKVSILCAALLASAIAALPARADSPQHFLRQAIRGDSSEIMLGRLAERRAATGDVRDFGRTLQSDHAKARNQAMEVARRMHISFNRSPTGVADNEAVRLRRMRGRDFDREFVRYMVNDHRKDVSDFRDEARDRHGPAGQLAARQLPTLRKHLDMALSLQNRMKDGRYAERDRYGKDNRNDYSRNEYRNNSDRSGYSNGNSYNYDNNGRYER